MGRAESVIALIKQDIPDRKIAEMLGDTISYVRSVKRRTKIKQPSGNKTKKLNDEAKQRVLEKLKALVGPSNSDFVRIGKEEGVTEDSIRYYAKKEGLLSRINNKTHKLNVEEEGTIILKVLSGELVSKVAKDKGLSVPSIYYILEKYEIEWNKIQQRHLTSTEEQNIIKLRLEKISMEEIALLTDFPFLPLNTSVLKTI